jgi:flagellar basal body rod protein FlgG
MNYGFYMATSGVLSGSHALDVAANNLANIETAGFKVDRAMIRQRQPARIEDGLAHLPSNLMLERLGGGVTPWPTRIDFGQGSLEITGNPLDAAIRGDGFFVVRDGADGEQPLRLTRDGRFVMNADGRLVTHDQGLPVLDARERPIRLDPSQTAVINGRGEIQQGGATVAQLAVVDVPDRQALIKSGDGLFTGPAGVMGALAAVESPVVRGGAYERSGADPIKALNAVRSAGSMAQRNARMIEMHNDAMRLAISRLGRVG